jgi:hypothetical protein
MGRVLPLEGLVWYAEIVELFSFQAPTKKGDRSTGVLSAKLDMSLWLGQAKHRHLCFESLPTGYEPVDGSGTHPSELSLMPAFIHYKEKHVRIYS